MFFFDILFTSDPHYVRAQTESAVTEDVYALQLFVLSFGHAQKSELAEQVSLFWMWVRIPAGALPILKII